MADWQKIESAPKDGTIFGWCRDALTLSGYIAFISWAKTAKPPCWVFNEDGSEARPTHWMPLPDPPEPKL